MMMSAETIIKAMSNYEKIASVIIAILVVAIVIISYHEIKEPPSVSPDSASRPGSDFDDSIGSNIKIGPFTSMVGEQVSGGIDPACTSLQPVILGVLHDIDVRLPSRANAPATDSSSTAFQVSQSMVQSFCNANADVTLADSSGDKLQLQKIPFRRAVPSQGTTADIGTSIRINATIIPAGAATPTAPTTYGELLIPDRFLDTDADGGH